MKSRPVRRGRVEVFASLGEFGVGFRPVPGRLDYVLLLGSAMRC